jgi:hypothetical protein
MMKYSEGLRIEAHSVESILIIVKTPTDTPKQHAFEISRNNSRSVSVVTFGELLKKLKTLREFLGGTE